MTKEQLKIYLDEAINALTEYDINALFPSSSQPDLYTIAKELIGLRGEVKRLSQTSLKVNNEVQSVLNTFKETREELKQKQAENSDKGTDGIDPDLRELLREILKLDAVSQKMDSHFEDLPELTWRSLAKYKEQWASWSKGYDISQKQWRQFVRSIGMLKTGLPNTFFDPKYHEAIATKDFANQPNNIILETEVIGYIYKQQLVQRAKVVVNKHRDDVSTTAFDTLSQESNEGEQL